MMAKIRRFLFWTFVFVIGCGLIIHYKVHVPYVDSFIGKLPGDMIVKKGSIKIIFPVTTAALASFLFTSLLSFFEKKIKS